MFDLDVPYSIQKFTDDVLILAEALVEWEPWSVFLSIQLLIGTPDIGIDSPALYSFDYRKYWYNFVVW